MATRSNPTRIVEKIFADSATIKNQDFYLWNRAVVTAASKTLTLPTPVAGLKGMEMWFTNASTGNLSVACTNGFLRDEDSMTVASKQEIKIECVYIGGTSYRWVVNPYPGTSGLTADELAAINGANSPSGANPMATQADVTTLQTEAVQDVVGAMFTGNTETGISISYQDGDGTIDAVVAYGSTASTACEGNDARIPTTEENAALIAYHRTGLTGGTGSDLDGILYASCADLMKARVTVGNNPGMIYDYVFDVDNAGAESSPNIIKPDDAGAADGRWVLARTLLTANQLAAVTGAATPTGSNVFATMNDIPSAVAGFDYVRTGLTGGTVNDLDGIAYASLAAGHTAKIVVGTNAGQEYHYTWDAASAAAESSPDTIRADDDGGGAGRWILNTLDGNMYEYGTAANTACQGNDARIPTTEENAALINFSATALTGGAAGALDAIPVASLANLSTARVFVGEVTPDVYFYQWDADSAVGEASPTCIAADDNGGAAGRWKLISLNGSMTSYGTSSTTACVGNDARLPTTEENTALVGYYRTGLTGGTGADLDGIDGALLTVAGTRALVVVGTDPGVAYHYSLDLTKNAAESSPDVIVPDANPGTKNWVLQSIAGEMVVYGSAASTACVGNDSRLPTAAQKTALFDYSATGLTGGGAGALDLIDGAALVDGDTALVVVGNNPGVAYIYVLDADNAGGESSPDIIAPDANGGNKRWVLATANGSMGDYGTTAVTACAGNDARLPTTAQKGALFDYSATALTGGGAGALDLIDGAALVDGDTAVVFVGNNPGVMYYYVLDADNAGAESSPDIIAPDANGGDKRWVLATSNGSMGDYGTTATTACVGNDARLLASAEATALAGTTDWAAWPAGPTWPSVPAVDTNVHKYRKMGGMCEIFIDIAGADGDGWTPSTVSDLPVAPVDWNGQIPLMSRQSVNAATPTDMLARVDAETDLRIEFDNAAACTNAQAWRIQIWGAYPIA